MDATATVHASCVAIDRRGVLITGASGSGKSALALQLMSAGASLVADDRVVLSAASDGRLTAACPPALRGLIEARGIGILNAVPACPVQLYLVVDLDRAETDRLPPRRTVTLLGSQLPLLYRVDGIHFASGIAQFLRAGRSA